MAGQLESVEIGQLEQVVNKVGTNHQARTTHLSTKPHMRFHLVRFANVYGEYLTYQGERPLTQYFFFRTA